MAIKITKFRTFLQILGTLSERRNFFAFVLYDERPSSIPVGEFFIQNFAWMNSLADAAEMYVFMYMEELPEDHSKEIISAINRYRAKISAENQSEPLKHEGTQGKNPCLKIAKMFGLAANQLPGIVFFTQSKFSEGEGILFTLNEKMFTDDLEAPHKLISDIFSTIQKCQRQVETDDALFQRVKEEFERLMLRESLKPMGKYLNRNLIAISNIPINFFDALGAGLGAAASAIIAVGKTP